MIDEIKELERFFSKSNEAPSLFPIPNQLFLGDNCDDRIQYSNTLNNIQNNKEQKHG